MLLTKTIGNGNVWLDGVSPDGRKTARVSIDGGREYLLYFNIGNENGVMRASNLKAFKLKDTVKNPSTDGDSLNYIHLIKDVETLYQGRELWNELKQKGHKLSWVGSNFSDVHKMKSRFSIRYTEDYYKFLEKSRNPLEFEDIKEDEPCSTELAVDSADRVYRELDTGLFFLQNGVVLQGTVYLREEDDKVFFNHWLEEDLDNADEVISSFKELYAIKGINTFGELLEYSNALSYRSDKMVKETSLKDLHLNQIEEMTVDDVKERLQESKHCSTYTINEVLSYIEQSGLRLKRSV